MNSFKITIKASCNGRHGTQFNCNQYQTNLIWLERDYNCKKRKNVLSFPCSFKFSCSNKKKKIQAEVIFLFFSKVAFNIIQPVIKSQFLFQINLNSLVTEIQFNFCYGIKRLPKIQCNKLKVFVSHLEFCFGIDDIFGFSKNIIERFTNGNYISLCFHLRNNYIIYSCRIMQSSTP